MALRNAIKEGSIDTFRRLLEEGADVDKADEDGITVLIYACQYDRIEIVRLLLEKGADVNHADETGKTVLMYACDSDIEIFKLLLEEGADVNKADEDGTTALMVACDRGYIDIVQLLLGDYAEDTDVNKADKYGKTALSYACIFGRIVDIDRIGIVRLLLEKGADVDYADRSSKTALIYACQFGRIEIVQLLLGEGADVEHADENGRTALIYACLFGDIEIVRLLLENGADVNKADIDGKTALIIAAEQGHADIVQLLEKRNIGNNNNAVNRAAGPRNIGNNGSRLGKCYDFLELENVNAKNYLKDSKHRILFMDTDKQVYCMRRTQRPLLFYACKQDNGGMRTTITNEEKAKGKQPERNPIDGTTRYGERLPEVDAAKFQYAKIGVNNNFVRRAELDKLTNPDYDIFVMRRSEEGPLVATCSEEVLNRGGSWVSANHCQEGSGGVVYTLDAYSWKDGMEHLPSFPRSDSGGRRRTKKHKVKKQRRATQRTNKIAKRIRKIKSVKSIKRSKRVKSIKRSKRIKERK